MTIAPVGRRGPPGFLVPAVWCAVVLLAAIGVGASVARGVFLPDLVARLEPPRQRILQALDIQDPFAQERPAVARLVDGRYAAHRGLTLLHVVPGSLFLAAAPLQFSRRLRTRHLRLHRWSGRVLLVLGVLLVLPGFYFGVGVPYAGWGEASAALAAGGLFLAALARAYGAIRRQQVAVHREWMLRAFAAAIGIATIRVIAAVLDLALTPAGHRPVEIFVLSLWSGWALTIGAAEAWIRYTRPVARSETAAAAAL